MIFVDGLATNDTTRLRLCASGFCSTKTAATKWLKHGHICMAIPDHDPPIDITVFMDVSQNPGPCRSDSLGGMVKQTGEFSRIDSVQIQHDLNPRKNCKLQYNFSELLTTIELITLPLSSENSTVKKV